MAIHKPVVNNWLKLWLILSAINTSGYSIVKFSIPTLELITHKEFTIKDSSNFDNEITTYDSLLCMANLDVESLFISISLNETVNNCVSNLYNKNPYDGKLSKRDLSKLLKIETSKSSLVFDYLLD